MFFPLLFSGLVPRSLKSQKIFRVVRGADCCFRLEVALTKLLRETPVYKPDPKSVEAFHVFLHSLHIAHDE